jgi:hypothetical protein
MNVVGKGSYGVVCAAIEKEDGSNAEKEIVAIKKI